MSTRSLHVPGLYLSSSTLLGLYCTIFASVHLPILHLSVQNRTKKVMKPQKSDPEMKYRKYLRIFRRKSKHTKFWTNSGTSRVYILSYSAFETAQRPGCINLGSLAERDKLNPTGSETILAPFYQGRWLLRPASGTAGHRGTKDSIWYSPGLFFSTAGLPPYLWLLLSP